MSDDIPRKTADFLPSPSDIFKSTISSSKKSVKSAASVSDTDYRKNSSRYRNIYIERERPPTELIRRAMRIISRRRESPEMDDAAIQKLRDRSRKLQDESEKKIVQQLARHIIPAMDEISDERLAGNADQLWFNSVPVPLGPKVLTNPLLLPRPKPDLAFG
jgi:molecular chaperone GrpE (heat shock protein)